MHLDARGLPISTATARAAAAYDYLVTGYLTQRADTPIRLTALLEADVCSGSKTDLTAPKSDFRITPESGLKSDIAPCPKSAMN